MWLFLNSVYVLKWIIKGWIYLNVAQIDRENIGISALTSKNVQPAKQNVQLASKFFFHFRRFYCTFSLNKEYSEVVVRRCFAKKVLLKILQNLQENTCARFSLLIKFFNKIFLLKKRLWHRCFPVNFAIISRTPFFIEQLWWLLLNIRLQERKVSCLLTKIRSHRIRIFTPRCWICIISLVDWFISCCSVETSHCTKDEEILNGKLHFLCSVSNGLFVPSKH